MPYNNSAITPSEELTGTTVLPLARVKKILAADEELGPVSSQAAFIIAKGAELFIQHLARKSFEHASNRGNKVKRSLTYNDVAWIVARLDHLEFLTDLVPETTTYREFKERKAREGTRGPRGRAAGETLPAGQTTLDRPPVVATQPTSPPTHVGDASVGGSPRPLSGHHNGDREAVDQRHEPDGERRGSGSRRSAADGDDDVEIV